MLSLTKYGNQDVCPLNDIRDNMIEAYMRAEKSDPGQIYFDFWDWLRTDEHLVWILSLLFAYFFYLLTTEEV
jgi:hypothetical protein